ncbi:MAG TPA: hypothetical protein VFX59_14255 [Polyangiales bacterium]|nr:hypothetical protein [Polyangiales bacterium]
MRSLKFCLAALMLTGCPEDDEVTLVADAAVDTQLSALDQATLDVLFVIDNSGSMASEQLKLAQEIPRMVAVLTSGDRYATREKDVPPGLDEKSRRFTPVRSLHLGVVSTNFGGVDELPSNSQAAIRSCANTGDSGKLLSSAAIATQGVIATTQSEFEGYGAGAVVLPPDPSCDLAGLPRYQAFEAGSDPSAAAHAFRCAARVGVRGCPFEQPLESMWSALAPSNVRDDLHTFLNGTRGNGDVFNAGFLRPGAALAVVLLTDEDDCSITDEGKAMFSLQGDAQAEYGNLNLRCMNNETDGNLVRAVERYRDGLLGLKPGHPERVVFTAIAGLPLDARSRSFDDVLADPSMVNAEDPQQQGFPRVSCTSAKGDKAYPARRLVRAAKLFPNALVESICAEEYASVVDATVNAIASLMGP